MYEVVDFTPLQVVLTYIAFLSACLITYPLLQLIMSAASKGLSKWR